MNVEGLQPDILLPAFAAGLLVLVTHVPLGREVLRRGIIFLDLAIAQIAGLGIVVAHALGLGDGGWRVQVAAVTAALLGALFLRWRERRDPERQEALIGIVFIVAACIAIVLLAKDAHGGEHLKELLVGQILWTGWRDLPAQALVAFAVLAGWHGLGLRRSPLGFYLLFALAITASVQVVGVYLVFATLILPALAADGRVGAGYGVGVAGYALGLVASALFDLPAGATIVLALAGVTAIARVARRGKG